MTRHEVVVAFTLMAVLGACRAASPPPPTDEAVLKPNEQAPQGEKSGDKSGVEGEAKPKAAPSEEGATIAAPSDVAAPPADAEKTASGLASKVLAPGKGGDKPKIYDKVAVQYTGWTTDGKMFDSSVQRGNAATFEVKGVIPGWTEGLQLMTAGEKRRMWIPEALAYKGRPGSPQGMLVFDVELIGITKGEAPIPAPPDVAAAPSDAQKTASGLSSKLIEKGKGKDKPHSWDRVEVNYTGWTTDGVMFDSSYKRGQSTKFQLDKVIPGWTEGLQLMSVGEKRRLWIPEELAYKGRPGAPKGMLVFDIELVSVERLPQPPAAPKDVAAAPKDAKRTASGMGYRVLKKGAGKAHPAAESRVQVHYTGWTTDGKMFDSSVTRNEPASFALNQVIPGWTEGVQLMVEGEKTRFWIPEELAYKGRPGAPQGMLVFDIELLKIEQ